MNPLVGLQTGWVPQQGLMGNVLQPSQQGLMGSGTIPSLQGVQPGDWSSVAYNMAGRPIQGPSPTAPGLPMPAGVSNGTQSSGGSALGGTALGILGALAKNPSLLKSAGSGVSSLWNSLTGGGAAASGAAGASGSGLLGGATAYGTDAGVTAGVSPLIADDVAATTGLTGAGLAPVGVDAVSELPSVSAAVNAGAAGSALAAGAAPAASNAIASGTAAASQTGAAGGSLLGAAAPLAVAGLVGLIGSGAFDSRKQADGTAAVQAWLKATGATSKTVNPPTASQASALAQGGFAGVGANYQPKTVTYGPNGKPMSDAAAQAAAYQWAQANGMPTGDLMSPAQAQQIISSGGYGSQVYSGPMPSNSGTSWLGLLGGR